MNYKASYFKLFNSFSVKSSSGYETESLSDDADDPGPPFKKQAMSDLDNVFGETCSYSGRGIYKYFQKVGINYF